MAIWDIISNAVFRMYQKNDSCKSHNVQKRSCTASRRCIDVDRSWSIQHLQFLCSGLGIGFCCWKQYPFNGTSVGRVTIRVRPFPRLNYGEGQTCLNCCSIPSISRMSCRCIILSRIATLVCKCDLRSAVSPLPAELHNLSQLVYQTYTFHTIPL